MPNFDLPGMSVFVGQLALFRIAPRQAWNSGTRINANFGRIQPLAFTLLCAIQLWVILGAEYGHLTVIAL